MSYWHPNLKDYSTFGNIFVRYWWLIIRQLKLLYTKHILLGLLSTYYKLINTWRGLVFQNGRIMHTFIHLFFQLSKLYNATIELVTPLMWGIVLCYLRCRRDNITQIQMICFALQCAHVHILLTRGTKNMQCPCNIEYLFHPFQRTELLKITRQGISWRYTDYKLNTHYC